jgi:hypothetical protein
MMQLAQNLDIQNLFLVAMLFVSSSLFGSGNSPVPTCTASIGCFGLRSASCGLVGPRP